MFQKGKLRAVPTATPSGMGRTVHVSTRFAPGCRCYIFSGLVSSAFGQGSELHNPVITRYSLAGRIFVSPFLERNPTPIVIPEASNERKTRHLVLPSDVRCRR